MNWKNKINRTREYVAGSLRALANKIYLEHIDPICIDQLPDGYLQQLLLTNHQICVIYIGHAVPNTADITGSIQFSYKAPLPVKNALPAIGEIIRNYLVNAVAESPPPSPPQPPSSPAA